jgi:hypothetical protein
MGWARYVARISGGDVNGGFWWGNFRERYYFEDLGVDGR